MVAKVAVLNVLAASAAVTNWESHGEVMDSEILAGPALNSELVGNQGTWIAGPNKRFEGMTLGEAKSLMGALQSTDPSTFLPFKAPEVWVEDLPTDFDWREQDIAAKCPSLKEIRDQAECGSCWAHGTTEAMTDRICIHSQGADTTHLSAEDVTSCCVGDMNQGCDGGIPADVYKYWKSTGVVDGGNYGDKSGCYSYQLEPCAHHTTSSHYHRCTGSPPTPKCEKRCIDNGANWKGSKNFGAEGGYSVCPQDRSKCVDHMMQEIYQNGPISAQFVVHVSFLSYRSGVYHHHAPVDVMLGGHAIKILGWGVEDRTPYWLVANSWNEDWGALGGFFKIKRGNNEGQIENRVINGGPVAGMPAGKSVTV